MAPDPAVASGACAEREVMAAVDGDRLVIADVAVDDAWLSVPRREARALSTLR